jgi:hypothetical protein
VLARNHDLGVAVAQFDLPHVAACALELPKNYRRSAHGASRRSTWGWGSRSARSEQPSAQDRSQLRIGSSTSLGTFEAAIKPAYDRRSKLRYDVGRTL